VLGEEASDDVVSEEGDHGLQVCSLAVRLAQRLGGRQLLIVRDAYRSEYITSSMRSASV
jgi:hypothetical protein